MKLVIQKVKEASVKVNGSTVGEIGTGFLVFLGIHKEDTAKIIPWFVQKLIGLRVFADSQDKMNLSLQDVKGKVLVISQFTLYGNCMNGRRPDFLEAAPPAIAEPIYQKFCLEIKDALGDVQAGEFGAHMEISLINDGPVTLVIEKNSGSI